MVARWRSRSSPPAISARRRLLLPPPTSTLSRMAQAAERPLRPAGRRGDSARRGVAKDVTGPDEPAVHRVARRHGPAAGELQIQDADQALLLALHHDRIARLENLPGRGTRARRRS